MAEILSVLKPGEKDGDTVYPQGQYVVSLTKDEAEWIFCVANFGNRGENGVPYCETMHNRIFMAFHQKGLRSDAWIPDNGYTTFAMERRAKE